MITLRIYIRQFVFLESIKETVVLRAVDFAGTGALETGMFREGTDHRDLFIFQKRQHAFILQ